MPKLQEILAAILGENAARSGMDKLEALRYSGGLGKGATNVEASPLLYLDPKKKATLVPHEEMLGREASFSPLAGIQVSNAWDHQLTLPGILSHEMFHAQDPGSTVYKNPDNRDFKARNKEASAKSEAAIEALAEGLARNRGKYGPGLTGQRGAHEVMAQTVGWESTQPAGQTFLRSELAKQLNMTPEQRLAYYRRRYPTPEGLDAMVGVRE